MCYSKWSQLISSDALVILILQLLVRSVQNIEHETLVSFFFVYILITNLKRYKGRRGRDGRMVVWFITTCSIKSIWPLSCEFQSHSWRGVLKSTLSDTVYQYIIWLSNISILNVRTKFDIYVFIAAGWFFSLGTLFLLAPTI
jgi:hypothetical protein